jgi:hypothetical protein
VGHGAEGENASKMGDRQNTVVCIFDPKSSRIIEYQINEWLHEALHLQEEDIRMVQIDGPQRRVYIKFVNTERMIAAFQMVKGQLEYHHENGELSLVKVELTGLGVKRVRIANLPTEITDRTIRDALTKYVEVKRTTEEQWSRIYRYSVYNGIRLVEIALQKHIPSHMSIMGNRILISYEGQHLTRYGCNESGHQYYECPHKKNIENNRTVTDKNTWAHVMSKGAPRKETTEEGSNREGISPDNGMENTEEDTHPIGRVTDQQHDGIARENVPASSSTSEGNQYAEDESERECDKGMMIDIHMGSKEESGFSDLEQDMVNEPSQTQNVDKESDKIGRKRANSHQARTDERAGKEDDECGPNDAMIAKSQTHSPKRNKKIKMESDQPLPRERTRSKTRLKTPQRS